MDEAVGVLADGRDGEGARAAAARVDGDEEVRRVGLGRAHVVRDLGRLALHEVADGLRVERLLGAVGRNAQTFTEQHGLSGKMQNLWLVKQIIARLG